MTLPAKRVGWVSLSVVPAPPLGRAVERGYVLIGYAREAGCLDDYVSSYLRGVWADGIDANTDQGLSRIVERARLDWDQARPWL